MSVRLATVMPKRVTDIRVHRDAWGKAVTATAKDLIASFEQTTRTWKHKPKFRMFRGSPHGRLLGVDVGTTNRIYAYVSDGTKPHLIRPRRGKVLRFKGRYRAKTRPRVIGSSTGGASGKYRYAKAVRHPGTKARLFNETIQEYHEKRGTLPNHLSYYLTQALSRG